MGRLPRIARKPQKSYGSDGIRDIGCVRRFDRIRPFLWALVGFSASFIAPNLDNFASLEDVDFAELLKQDFQNQTKNSIFSKTEPSYNLEHVKFAELLKQGKQKQTNSSIYSKTEPSDNRKRVYVFYHTYSGSETESKALTRTVVKDQLKIIGEASNLDKNSLWELRYGSVGEENVVNQVLVDPYCNEYDNLSCSYQGHTSNGHEEITLQQMHGFCIKNPNETVVYVHTKGTLHDMKMNAQWRLPLTLGATKSSCLAALQDDTCNVCGLQFYPLWNPMFPGNMFSAKCSYIQNLKPLLEFREALTATVGYSSNHSTVFKHELYKKFFPKSWVDIAGLERYANEQWIASHPTVRPCDSAAQYSTRFPLIRGPKKRQVHLDRMSADLAPRTPLKEGNWFRMDKGLFRRITKNDGARPHEWFSLPGILYRHWRIYGVFPPEGSWFWHYYPNGMVWQKKVEEALKSGEDFEQGKIW